MQLVIAPDGRVRAIYSEEIALDALARNELARTELLRGAFKLDALQRGGPCISHQRTQQAPEHQHCRGLQKDCAGQWRLPTP